MTERTLLDEPNQQLVVAEQPHETPPELQTAALSDFRQAFMLLPRERMEQALTDYSDKRDMFRKWLLSQMRAGVHFGVPPGCEPRDIPNPEQWQNKPSLYKAGAELIYDLMGARPVFKADPEAWKSLGAKEGMVVIKCELYSKFNDTLLGEGMGVFSVGEKKMGPNSAVKLAEKRAKVDAVLNTWGLSDLFSQDLDDPEGPLPPPLHPNPTSNRQSPRAETRKNRVVPISVQDMQKLAHAYCGRFGVSLDTPEAKSGIADWIRLTTGREFNVSQVNEWSRGDWEKCMAALEPPVKDEPF